MNAVVFGVVVLAYVAVTAFLGWLGYRHTRNAADYLVGGREVHPLLMALTYGATFVSTAAIVGFGGVAANLGLGILWLPFLNIFAGVFIAFVVFGRRTREMGAALDAHTFPEFLGRRFNSRFIQGFTGLLIALLMPLYAAAVMIGGARFIETSLKMRYEYAVLGLAVVVLVYVFFGGLKGVIYTDAFQGGLMFVGMLVLLVVTYLHIGPGAHEALNAVWAAPEAEKLRAGMEAAGSRGWTSMPAFASPLWWTMVSTIIMGVGVGVLAQPQLAARFMTVKSGKELNRALAPGAIFVLIITGTAYMVGALCNVHFYRQERKTAVQAVMEPLPPTIKELKDPAGIVAALTDTSRPEMMHVRDLMSKDTWEAMGGLSVRSARLQMALVREFVWLRSAPGLYSDAAFAGVPWADKARAAAADVPSPTDPGYRTAIVLRNSTLLGMLFPGQISLVRANTDRIIPRYIEQATPGWFGYLFMLTLLAAAMSTLSGQFHTIGTAVGRDLFQQALARGGLQKWTVPIAKAGIVAAFLMTWVLALKLGTSVVAIATALFFGMCAATFLPAYVSGLFWKRATRAGVTTGMLVGCATWLGWTLFVHQSESASLGVCAALFDRLSLLYGTPWVAVDPLFIALPASALVTVAVSLATKSPVEVPLALQARKG